MYIIINESTDPYFNLAAEQWLLDGRFDSVFMLWRNAPAVIIGRNQNAYAEINLPYVDGHGIKVVRRLTGGGAVFHDLGNLNYTFIQPERKDCPLDFARFCSPVIDALRSLGADAGLSGRNDIMAGGKKVSGSAQTVRNGKTMHHGTLLYCADLSYVAGALNVNAEKLKSKGIKSVSSRVGNIRDCIDPQYRDMDVLTFRDRLAAYIGAECEAYTLTEADKAEIGRLADERYSTWEWNFGQSKRFDNMVSRRYDFGSVEISYTLDGGIISDLRITGDFFGKSSISELESTLTGSRFVTEDIKKALAETDVNTYISGANADMLTELLTAIN